jgi:hypothetical protein
MTTFVSALPKETLMHKRLVELLVDAASNDYEDYDMIRCEVEDWAREENAEFSGDDLKKAIQESIENGLLQSYRYSKGKGQFEPCEFRIEDVDRVSFLATQKGRSILRS